VAGVVALRRSMWPDGVAWRCNGDHRARPEGHIVLQFSAMVGGSDGLDHLAT
jgi:hypothetical protein